MSQAFSPIRSRTTHSVLLATLLWSATLSGAVAGEAVSSDQIIKALQPKPLTRSLSQPRPDPAVEAKQTQFLDQVRNRRTRSLSSGEREEISEIAAAKPQIDLEINFDYNSADISQTSLPNVQALGRALSDPNLKGSTFVVAGHTDAAGSEGYNQELSERRADSIKRYLVEKFNIAGENLVTVGYGKTKPKDPNAPMDPLNRRVQVVNMIAKTASN
jgi:outer membrane protein OmpA-like peptidoglycan-associated protein